MLNRSHYLISNLFTAIDKYDEVYARKHIKLILSRSNVQSLKHLDDQGNNLISLSLKAGLDQLAFDLFELLKSDTNFIYHANIEGLTSLWYATERYQSGLATRILSLAQSSEPNTSSINRPFWLQVNKKNGKRLLHLVVRDEFSHELLKFYLNILQQELDPQEKNEIINYCDFEGKTPLFIACERACLPAIITLIQHGSDISLRSSANVTPLSLMLSLPQEQQLQIYRALNSEQRDEWMSSYSAAQAAEKARFHLRANATSSLQDLIVTRVRHGVYPFAFFKQPNLSQPLCEKLGEAKNVLPADKSKAHFLQNDRATLVHLIDDIEKMLADLNTKPSCSRTYRACVILFPLIELVIILIGGILTAKLSSDYGNKSARLLNKYYDDNYDYYNNPNTTLTEAQVDKEYQLSTDANRRSADFLISSILIFVIGTGFDLLMTYLSWRSLWNKERIIDTQEWQPLIRDLQNDVLDKLHYLEKCEQNQQRNDLLPVNPAIIRDLEGNMDAIQLSPPVKTAVDLLNSLKTILDDIQKHLCLRQRSLSQFYKPQSIIIPIPEEALELEDEADENRPLLFGM